MERRGRSMDANESQAVLIETEKKNSLVSWFQPFTDQMIDAIKRGRSSVIFDGKLFNVKPALDGVDFIFSNSYDFTPMTRVSLENLESRRHAES